MSRLDSFIRRLQAQRDILNWAAEAVAGQAGTVLEIGLGNGRTYDHLCSRFDRERIYAFDRANNANPRSQPPAERLVLGEFSVTLSAFAKAHPDGAVLVHSDVGLGDPDANARQVIMMGQLLPSLLAPGGLLLSDQNVSSPDLLPQPLPVPIPPDRYFVYIRR
ncbi:MAG: class I SAM-dependent methyltransferase [Ferrovibrio sp.]|jgi:hypothetical protein|uniref:class I SAM-dependent methyltransferase n=1 Tax=Ferrovibrio sp. TaxID=1917215 RepID=UPI00391C97D9